MPDSKKIQVSSAHVIVFISTPFRNGQFSHGRRNGVEKCHRKKSYRFYYLTAKQALETRASRVVVHRSLLSSIMAKKEPGVATAIVAFKNNFGYYTSSQTWSEVSASPPSS